MATRFTGCPCGCQSGAWGDDPDCIRHKPDPPRRRLTEPADHDPKDCPQCYSQTRRLVS